MGGLNTTLSNHNKRTTARQQNHTSRHPLINISHYTGLGIPPVDYVTMLGLGWDEGWCAWVAFVADDEGVSFGAVGWLEHAG